MFSVRFAVGYKNREFKIRGRFARSKFLLHASLAAALLKFITIKPIPVETELFNSLKQALSSLQMFMKLTTKPEFNTAFPHSSSLVSTTQDLNNAHVRNVHIKPSVWSLHSNTLLSSPLKINLLHKRTFISFPLLPYPFPTLRFCHLIIGPLPIPLYLFHPPSLTIQLSLKTCRNRTTWRISAIQRIALFKAFSARCVS
jgi:hypothetical protein